MSRPIRTALLLAAVLVVLTACAAGPNTAAAPGSPEAAGFWLGLWHGAISPVTFVISLFNDDVNLYEVHNNGAWYNVGFMLGVSLPFGGFAGSTCNARSRARRR